MPTANKPLKDDERKLHNSPRMDLTMAQRETIIRGQTITKSAASILPSKHLKLSMANPRDATRWYFWNCQFLVDTNNSSSQTHKQLLFGSNASKIPKADKTGEYYKVLICPVILFSDDTSGAISKQFIPYESWSMVYAGLPYEDRGRRENTKFIGCVPKKEGMSSMSFIPGLVADMKELEKGVKMYSCVYEELVIVKSPLLFITADNPAHSNICGLLQQTTVYPCRKCYYKKPIRSRNQTVQESSVTIEQLNRSYPKRTRHHYTLAASNADRPKVRIPNVLATRVSAEDLSFKNTRSDALLQLSSYDPSLDTPIEALHCIPLGVAKYLVERLVLVVLAGKSNKLKIERLEARLNDQVGNKAYSRTFRKKLRHVGSFLGRDYKILVQTLPGIIATEFTDTVEGKDILLLNKSLTALGKLCSSVFVRQIEGDLEEYIEAVKTAVEDLTSEMFEFDLHTNNSKPFCVRPKVHYLHHLHEDIRRFGCALHFETEKGEMYNKFIREQLFLTNRLHPSRDVAVRYSKQALLKHVMDGRSWINKYGKRMKYASDIESFIKSDEVSLRREFFGAREFVENNYTPVNQDLVTGFKGVFQLKNENDGNFSFIGVVDGHYVREYKALSEDLYGRLECQSTDTVRRIEQVLPLGVLDMCRIPPSPSVSPNTICFKLNLNKFGTIPLLRHANIYKTHH